MKRFILLFERLHEPDMATQHKRGGEWFSRIPEGVSETAASFETTGKVIQRDSVLDYSKYEKDFGGYMIIRAASVDEAVKIAQGAPHIDMGGKIVVIPLTDM
jgi:hypothetical protein